LNKHINSEKEEKCLWRISNGLSRIYYEGRVVHADDDLIKTLTALNHISETLNQAVDVRAVLDDALADLVKLMGLISGWIVLKEPADQDRSSSSSYVLTAHHNLPPALAPDNAEVWEGRCTCETLCDRGRLSRAYNEVRCNRLAQGRGDRRGLSVHASAPLCSGDRVLGILNVAAPDWDSFSAQALSLLTNVGNQIGIALERAQLYDLLRARRIHEQKMLIDFSHQLLSRRNLNDLIHDLVQQVRQVLHADACTLLLPSKEPGFLDFRASSGWRLDPSAEGRRLPANGHSGPGLVMLTQQPLLVKDIQDSDPTRWQPAWLRAEGFRGHAALPLLVDGHSVGVLVINQRQPRLVHRDDVRCLSLMANQAAMAIEQARLQQDEITMQTLEKELALGRQIQLSLLPSAPSLVPGWEFATLYEAAREVGGDFYDVFELPGEPGRLGMVIADVTGKGVPAALFMARSSALIRSAGLQVDSPSATLMQVNESILKKDEPAELLLTAFYAVLDTSRGRLVYANGGHCRPLWFQAATGTFQELASRSVILGAFDRIELEEREIEVEPGDLLVFYTDGVTEAMDANGELFGKRRLQAVVGTDAGASAQQLLEAVVDAVQAFTGPDSQSDDIALLVVKRCHQDPR
jgi:sigma-B regulation protein RsbU (phosphoserine phosphatase)